MPLDHPSRELMRLIEEFNQSYPHMQMNDLSDLNGRLDEFLALVDASPKADKNFRRFVSNQKMDEEVRVYLKMIQGW